MGRAFSTHRREEEWGGFFVGKSEGTRPLERHRRRWEDNIKIVLRGKEWSGIYWVSVAQNRDLSRAHVSTLINPGVL
jgi:hypothetical protein